MDNGRRVRKTVVAAIAAVVTWIRIAKDVAEGIVGGVVGPRLWGHNLRSPSDSFLSAGANNVPQDIVVTSRLSDVHSR